MSNRDDLADILNALCPLHAVLDETGHIRGVGATLQKLRPDAPMIGRRFLEVFELTRPRAVNSMAGLLGIAGTKLHLQFRDRPHTTMKGIMVPMPDGGSVVNLSFGISVVDAVSDYALTSADFSATDLTVEMLYLVEAKSAAMEASRTLNLRLQGAMIAAEEQAFTDTLTGLKNRRAMDHILARLTAAGAPFALMHLDLDFFKTVNDTLGHAAGDHVLQHVARIMVEETRDVDTVARVGGDEFVLIIEALQDRRQLSRIAARLIQRIEIPIPFNDQSCEVSASIGIALSNGAPGQEGASLIDDADTALYAAKRAGRACHRFYQAEMREVGDASMAMPAAMSRPSA